MSIDYTHCLRRQFTENILTDLLNGTSVNVVVPRIDAEADRLVADIQRGDLPNTRVLAVNMRFCRGSYQQFLLDLWQQYHQQPADESPKLFDILSELEQAAHRFIIILNRLDAMAENEVDAQFNQGFYERLNSLKNYRHVALLVITHQRYDEILFNIEGEFKTSKLDIQTVEDLPALTMDEARYELKQRHSDLSDVHISHLMQQGRQGNHYNYAVLDYLSRQLNHSPQSWADMSDFIRQIKLWHKQYLRQQPKQRPLQNSEYRVKKGVETVNKLVDILKIKPLLRMIYDILRTVFSEWRIVLIEKLSELFRKRQD